MELRNQAIRQNILFPAEAIANSIDLLTKILFRLPAKFLVRSKCVSKQWLSLISDPQLCLSHTLHHYQTPTALLLDDVFSRSELKIVPLKQDTIPKLTFFHYLNVPYFSVRQSCNGLLLCTSFIRRIFIEVCYICNPTTNQFKRIYFPKCKSTKYLPSVSMAFDPLKSNHYKVICIRKLKNTDKCQIDMYSSETDSWRLLDITFTPPNLVIFSVAVVFYNGAVHWYSKGETSIYFDVDRECFNTMPMPQLSLDCHEVQYFGESRGHLHLIVTKHHYPSQFDILEMVPDYSTWFVRYHVDLDAVRVAFPKSEHTFSILHVIRVQEEEELIVVIGVDNDGVISYNVQDGTINKVCDLEPRDCYRHCFRLSAWRNTFQYFEILTSV